MKTHAKVNKYVRATVGPNGYTARGLVQGYMKQDPDVALVRLPLDEGTRPLLMEPYCNMPRAKTSALFEIHISKLELDDTQAGAKIERPKSKRKPPATTNGETLTAMIKHMYAEKSPSEAIQAAAVDHAKYAGDPKKAKAYVRMYIRHYLAK